ncbi:DUF2599 domain-containing protein [Nocardia anaemiae]|uniref:DUF2599 domain-containing protein n=1 Tax=Nocardia anaemiae TaxID=263910 RepID=UPI0007A37AC6|nr:DUF2599 domain-containing protein [Nocardia anaemiae]
MTQRTTGPAQWGAVLLCCGALVPAVAACGADETPSAAPTTTPTTTAARVTTTPLAAPPSVDPYAGMPLIDHTTWTESIDGPRLLVYPTAAGRRETFPNTEERAWQEVLTDSPDADSPGMRDQFVCHWVWARMVQPDKESWNLEPWRPAVGYQATVQASCNPGGPER